MIFLLPSSCCLMLEYSLTLMTIKNYIAVFCLESLETFICPSTVDFACMSTYKLLNHVLVLRKLLKSQLVNMLRTCVLIFSVNFPASSQISR